MTTRAPCLASRYAVHEPAGPAPTTATSNWRMLKRSNIPPMAHPLVLALFGSPASAASAARALHECGVARDEISVISRSHDEEGALAEQMDASPGVEIEDSRAAARLGELSGQVLAAIAVVLPGIGPIVAAGPLSAGLGEAAGHVAGGLIPALKAAGVPADRAAQIVRDIERGAVLLAVHASPVGLEAVREALASTRPRDLDVVNWEK